MNGHDELIEQTVTDTLRMLQALKLRGDSSWLQVDLTMRQFKALFLLYPVDGLPMKRLAEGLGVSVTAITGLVDRLVEHELAWRDQDPDDRRLVIARLTDSGRTMVERLQSLRRDRLAWVFQRLSIDDLQVIDQAVRLVYRAVMEEER